MITGVSIAQNKEGVFIYLDRSVLAPEALHEITDFIFQHTGLPNTVGSVILAVDDNEQAEIEAMLAQLTDDDKKTAFTEYLTIQP